MSMQHFWLPPSVTHSKLARGQTRLWKRGLHSNDEDSDKIRGKNEKVWNPRRNGCRYLLDSFPRAQRSEGGG